MGAVLIAALMAPNPAWAMRVGQPRGNNVAAGLEDQLHDNPQPRDSTAISVENPRDVEYDPTRRLMFVTSRLGKAFRLQVIPLDGDRPPRFLFERLGRIVDTTHDSEHGIFYFLEDVQSQPPVHHDFIVWMYELSTGRSYQFPLEMRLTPGGMAIDPVTQQLYLTLTETTHEIRRDRGVVALGPKVNGVVRMFHVRTGSRPDDFALTLDSQKVVENLHTPDDIAVNPDQHEIYILERRFHQVRVFDGRTGQERSQLTITGLQDPQRIAFDRTQHRLFITEQSGRLRAFQRHEDREQMEEVGPTIGGLRIPRGIAVASAAGVLLVAESGANRISMYSLSDGKPAGLSDRAAGLEEGRAQPAPAWEVVVAIAKVLTEHSSTTRSWDWSEAMAVVRPALETRYPLQDLRHGLQTLGVSSPDETRRTFLTRAFSLAVGATVALKLRPVIWWGPGQSVKAPAPSEAPAIRSSAAPQPAPAAPPARWETVRRLLNALDGRASNVDATDRVLRLFMPGRWQQLSAGTAWRDLSPERQQQVAQHLAEWRFGAGAVWLRVAEAVRAKRIGRATFHRGAITRLFRTLNDAPYDGRYAEVYRKQRGGQERYVPVPWEAIVGQLLKETTNLDVRAHAGGQDGRGLMQAGPEILDELVQRLPQYGVLDGIDPAIRRDHDQLLLDPTVNVAVGALYMQDILARLHHRIPDPDDRLKLALFLYNRGWIWALGEGSFDGAVKELAAEGISPTYEAVKERMRRYLGREITYQYEGRETVYPVRTLTADEFRIGENYVDTIWAMVALFRVLEAPARQEGGLEEVREIDELFEDPTFPFERPAGDLRPLRDVLLEIQA